MHFFSTGNLQDKARETITRLLHGFTFQNAPGIEIDPAWLIL